MDVRTFSNASMANSSSEIDPPSAEYVALRAAFAGAGINRSTANHFLSARAKGLEWPLAARAVADGLAARAGHIPRPTVPERPSYPPTWSRVPLAIGLYVVLRPVLGLGHELAVSAVAFATHQLIAKGWWEPVITWAGLDPIYTGTAVRAIGGVEVLGLAVAAPFGEGLHALAPLLFQAPLMVVPGAGISMVAGPGTPALGRELASFGADVIWLTIGLALFVRWRRRSWALALLGLFIQAQIAVNHLFGASVSLPDLEASGLPFALAAALPDSSGGVWFTSVLAQLPEWVQDGVIGGTLLVAGYAVAGALLATGYAVRRLIRRHATPTEGSALVAAQTQTQRLPLAPIGAALAVVIAISPIGALAFGQPNWQAQPPSAQARPGVAGRRELSSRQPIDRPSTVKIEQSPDGAWQYLVDGQPTVVRGVGYNPEYASLATGDRQQSYQRDFSAMHRMGVNTIEGWFESQFDAITLDAAARNGIGVLMPFELNQDWPYENPNVQQSILDHVSAYVEKYKNHPAVRMWAPGNENMHRILYPHLVSKQNDPQASARAAAFAAFLPVLVDRIHELDPNHPVLYRDAEDVYLAPLKAAFEATGVPRPWLVYGANVYSSSRLQEIVARWPAQWTGGPLVISEFGPSGASHADRPLGYQQDWSVIRSRPDFVLGGLAYTWATNGPEELDRVFGLVDPSGVPTDGSLTALNSAFFQSP